MHLFYLSRHNTCFVCFLGAGPTDLCLGGGVGGPLVQALSPPCGSAQAQGHRLKDPSCAFPDHHTTLSPPALAHASVYCKVTNLLVEISQLPPFPAAGGMNSKLWPNMATLHAQGTKAATFQGQEEGLPILTVNPT